MNTRLISLFPAAIVTTTLGATVSTTGGALFQTAVGPANVITPPATIAHGTRNMKVFIDVSPSRFYFLSSRPKRMI